tara:strand:+ start:311 stop:1036 length:726 start_codon:yes stop_codon:yes gene_type:complete
MAPRALPQSRATVVGVHPNRYRGAGQIHHCEFRSPEAKKARAKAHNKKPLWVAGPKSRSKAKQGWTGYLANTEGWKACVKHLSTNFRDLVTCPQGSTEWQLIHINKCWANAQGSKATVNWYIGGHSDVDTVARSSHTEGGVYLARTRWYHPGRFERDQRFVQTKAHVDRLQKLGNTAEFFEMTKANRTKIGKTKYDRLVGMMTRWNEASEYDGERAFHERQEWLAALKEDFERSQYGGGGL